MVGASLSAHAGRCATAQPTSGQHRGRLAHNLRAGLLAAALASLAALAAATEVNTASQAQLESIKGIGPALSQRLLDERARAPFQDWADLLKRAGGIKAAAAARLSAAGLTVNGSAYAVVEAPTAPASR